MTRTGALFSTLSGARVTLFALAGILSLTALDWQQLHAYATSVTDFSAFYTAGSLAGSNNLYDYAPYKVLEKTLTGAPNRFMIRMPWNALLWKPLSLLPCTIAVWGWNFCMIGCLAAFICLIPVTRSLTLLTLCWSTRVFVGLNQGQDDAIVLLLAGAAIACATRAPFRSGVLLSFCTLKPHLVLLLPLVLIVKNEKRTLGGFVAGCGLLTILSFAVDPGWILHALTSISLNLRTDYWELMPNLHGVLHGWPSLEFVASAAVVAAIIWGAPGLTLDLAIALAFTGGLLLARHSYPQDLLLAYPLALLLLDRGVSRLPVLWISPVLLAGFLSPQPPRWQTILAVAFLVLLLCVTLNFARQNRTSQSSLLESDFAPFFRRRALE